MQTFLAGLITALSQLCAGFVIPAPLPVPLPSGVAVADHSLSAGSSAYSSATDEPGATVVTTPPIDMVPSIPSNAHVVTLLTGAWVSVDHPSLILVGVDGSTARSFAAVNAQWLRDRSAGRVAVIGWDDGCNTGTQIFAVGADGVVTGGPATSSKVGCGSSARYELAQRFHELLAGPSTVTRGENSTIIVTNNATGDAMTFRNSLTRAF